MLVQPAIRGLRRAQANKPLLREKAFDPDERLYAALQSCLAAEALIEPEQEKIRKLIDAAQSDIERQFRWYQFELVNAQLTRAARIAEKRLEHLATLKQSGDYEEEFDLCSNGIEGTLRWFRYYAWGYDPREDSPLAVMPFYPFTFQERYLRWIEDTAFNRRTSGLIEKCRDAGATVGFICWAIKQWRFKDGFSALLTSATEDLIDSKKDPDTLFEKARFQMRLLPSWMLPKGFSLDRDMPYMNIANPENSAVITGSPPTARVGRQRRATVVLADEFPTWPFGGYPQDKALSQTTRSFFKLGTPDGMFNAYADERHSGRANVFVMDWHEHPWKDERWYDALPYGYGGKPMTPEQIASEVDRDYKASQPGRILTMWDDILSIITWEDFKRVYGVDHIPRTWNLARLQDVGTTEDHLNVTAWYTRPRKDDPFADTIFAYREFVAPTDWPVEWIGEGRRDEQGNVVEDGIQQFETPLKEGERMTVSQISQEGESEQRTYRYTCKRYPIRFKRIKKPQANAGISEMRALMTALPEANPFVIDPRTTDPKAVQAYVPEHECKVCKATHDGEHLIGRTRYVLIVNKDEGELLADGERLYRPPAKTSLGGQKEARREYPLYHYPATEKDKPVAARKPFKRDDDRIDDDRYLCRIWGPSPANKTTEEDFEEQLPEHLRQENLRPQLDADGRLQMSAREQEELAQRRLTREVTIALRGIKSKPKKAVHWKKKKQR